MDEFDIRSSLQGAMEGGTLVTTRKWVADAVPQRFVTSANSRPCTGETDNGDTWLVEEDAEGLLVAVADGLGHGAAAASASQAAIEHIRKRRGIALDGLALELHDVLRGTRGAAVTVVRLSLEARRVSHVGVGNVEARVYPVGRARLLARPGIVGMGPPPRPRVNEIDWPADGTLIVYSDGLSAKWDLRETPPAAFESPAALGRHLMAGYARSNDDATVVVAREAR